MRFWSYLLRRIGLIIPILFGVTILVFVITHIIPGDPAMEIAGMNATDEQIERLREEFGLDKPIPMQYWIALRDMLFEGEFGTSLYTNRPVVEDLAVYWPATFELTTFSLLLAIVLGIPLGVVSAWKSNRAADHTARMGSLAGMSLPPFWLGLMLQIVLGHWWDIMPVRGRIDTLVSLDYPIQSITGMYLVDSLVTANWPAFRDSLAHIFVPGFVLALAPLALISRMTRSGMLEVFREDYIKTARGAGLPDRTVVYRHALKNALIPTVTVAGSTYGFLLGGSFVVETVFDWPGMGLYGAGAILELDFPAIIGITIAYALMRVSVNLLVDMSYYFLDPRVKLAGKYEE
ncbi:MAG: ABC transporter permease [Nitrospinota bacterium]|nr:ABC transporter permease [Nitrospinota bacterium]